MLILGIETSCDETAASVVRNGREILSNVISSSLRYHKKFGGVVPEIATRHHAENIDKVAALSLKESRVSISDIDAVAVTEGPGLPGALLIGISCAKAMSYALCAPLILIDHVKAHVYSSLMEVKRPEFPFVGLAISGGHTRLYLVRGFHEFKVLGDTVDDAVGEAYDKVAKILGLGYPGGPLIDKLAKRGNPSAIRFTCRPVKDSLDFSFSGLKTAVLYHVKARGSRLTAHDIKDICASFQESALNVIVENSIRAMERHKIKTLVIGGGVSANSRLREKFQIESKMRGLKVYFPPLNLCSDNAAMVAGLAYQLRRGIYDQ
ncbi:MAG: tRNA (adenosine(37)-N6)-threonylcarbamoyltransferase complex transferase subunit TsaD [Candidatus Omnitrophota bacterium]